jgi:hypothetical protein
MQNEVRTSDLSRATCIGNSGQSSDICISSNGRVVSSTYLFRKHYKIKGTHTGCFGTTAKITCSGGSFKTADGSGKLTRVVISLKDGKPVSMSLQ